GLPYSHCDHRAAGATCTGQSDGSHPPKTSPNGPIGSPAASPTRASIGPGSRLPPPISTKAAASTAVAATAAARPGMSLGSGRSTRNRTSTRSTVTDSADIGRLPTLGRLRQVAVDRDRRLVEILERPRVDHLVDVAREPTLRIRLPLHLGGHVGD